MPESWTNQCWDSGLLVAVLTKQEPDKVAVVRDLIDLFERKELQIVVSTAAIAEIRPYKESQAAPGKGSTTRVARHDITQEAVIAALLDNDRLDIRPVTPAIAKLAAEIGNKHPSLLPMDCIHIATALTAKCDVLFTWDGKGKRRRPGDMLKFDGLIGLPPMAIKVPFNPKPSLGFHGMARNQGPTLGI